MSEPTFDPGPLAEVRCETEGDRQTLVFVRELHHPREAVWAALTDPGQLRAWAPFTSDRDLSQLGDATLTMIDGETAVDLSGSVRQAERPALLEYQWGDDVVRWELVATEAGTRLTLRHTVDGPDMPAKAAAGWHLCLVVMERLLDGEPIEPIRGDDARNYGWEELNEAYARELDANSPT